MHALLDAIPISPYLFPMAKGKKLKKTDSQKKAKLSQATGQAPGTMIHLGRESTAPVGVTVYAYNTDNLVRSQNVVHTEVRSSVPPDHNAWINIDGVHDTDIIQSMGDQFKLHPLVMEDIVNTQERPKIENYEHFLYFVMTMADLGEDGEILLEQVSIVLGENYILSFQEDPDDIFEPIRNRLRKDGTRVRKSSPDYLAYLLLDAVVDRYFLILEVLGERIDELEEELMDNPVKDTLQKIYSLKREITKVRRAVWPMREIVSNMQRESSMLMHAENEIFLRDFYDHIIRVIDTVETYRDAMASMIDLYISSSSIRMNEIMKVLTVISTIFIPLTFLTGFYGMNFDFMPELHSEWSYPIIVGVMALMVAGQLIYFKRKKWL